MFKAIGYQLKIGLSLILSGCTTTRNLALDEEDLFFVLASPFTSDNTILPNGAYHCYYKDKDGCYFAAPATIRSGFAFSDGNTGGVYITDSEPRHAFLYFQDKETQTTYVASVGMITVGGSGGFRKSQELKRELFSKITIEKGGK